jgi:hypothetical protein
MAFLGMQLVETLCHSKTTRYTQINCHTTSEIRQARNDNECLRIRVAINTSGQGTTISTRVAYDISQLEDYLLTAGNLLFIIDID